MNKICKSALFYISFLIVSSLLFMCLMWWVYLIPIEKIRPNVAKSVNQVSVLLFSDFHSYKVHKDDFTDALMLNKASFLGREPLYDALLNPRVEPAGRWNQLGDLAIGVNTPSLSNMPIIDYGRYVHGHLLFLKPLFVFFDLTTIRYINLFVHMLLLGMILFLLYRKLNLKYSLAYLFSMFFLNPMTTWQCLVYAIDVNLMLLASLWVLLNKNPNDKYMFFIIGAMVIFDFPCFPLLSLGIPLIIYICLYERSFKDNIKCVIQNSLLWGAGYIGMLANKWLLATIITQQNVLADGWENVLHRTIGKKEEINISFLTTVKLNLAEYYQKGTIWWSLLFVMCLVLVYFIRPYRINITKKVLIVLGIGLMPFAWYFVVTQHTIIHHFFTYRIVIISIYAILTALACSLPERKITNAG